MNLPSQPFFRNAIESVGNPLQSAMELDRRALLKNVSVGTLGAGLMTASSDLLAQEESQCFQLLRLSKGLGAEIRNYKCRSCKCRYNDEVLVLFDVSFEFKGLFTVYRICDESMRVIPNQSTLTGQINYRLRTTTCPRSDKPVLVGCHEGKFSLYNRRTRLLFSGTMSGTDGVDPNTSGAERCCWPYGRGMLKGRGEARLSDCEICASYLLKVPFEPKNACEPVPTELSAQFDGALICPCREE